MLGRAKTLILERRGSEAKQMCVRVAIQFPLQEVALGEVRTWRSVDNCAIPSEVICNALP